MGWIGKTVNLCWHYISCSLRRRLTKLKLTHYIRSIRDVIIDLDRLTLCDVCFDHLLITNTLTHYPIKLTRATIDTVHCTLLPWSFTVEKSVLVLNVGDGSIPSTPSRCAPQESTPSEPEKTRWWKNEPLDESEETLTHGALSELVNLLGSMVQNLIHAISVNFEDITIMIKLAEDVSPDIDTIILTVDAATLSMEHSPLNSLLKVDVQKIHVEVQTRSDKIPLTIFSTDDMAVVMDLPNHSDETDLLGGLEIKLPNLSVMCGLDLVRKLSRIKIVPKPPSTPYLDVSPVQHEESESEILQESSGFASSGGSSSSSSTSGSTDVLGWVRRLIMRVSGMQLPEEEVQEEETLKSEYLELKSIFGQEESSHVDDDEKKVLLNLMQSTADLKQYILDDLKRPQNEQGTSGDFLSFIWAAGEVLSDPQRHTIVDKLCGLLAAGSQLKSSFTVQIDRLLVLVPDLDSSLRRRSDLKLEAETTDVHLFELRGEQLELSVAASGFQVRVGGLGGFDKQMPLLTMGSVQEALVETSPNSLPVMQLLAHPTSVSEPLYVSVSLAETLKFSIFVPHINAVVTEDILLYQSPEPILHVPSSVTSSSGISTPAMTPVVSEAVKESPAMELALTSSDGFSLSWQKRDVGQVQCLFANVDFRYRDREDFVVTGDALVALKLDDLTVPLFLTNPKCFPCLSETYRVQTQEPHHTQSIMFGCSPTTHYFFSAEHLDVTLPCDLMPQMVNLIPNKVGKSVDSLIEVEEPESPTACSNSSLPMASSTSYFKTLEFTVYVEHTLIVASLNSEVQLRVESNAIKAQLRPNEGLVASLETLHVTGIDGEQEREFVYSLDEGQQRINLTWDHFESSSLKIRDLHINCDILLLLCGLYAATTTSSSSSSTSASLVSLELNDVHFHLDEYKLLTEFPCILAQSGLISAVPSCMLSRSQSKKHVMMIKNLSFVQNSTILLTLDWHMDDAKLMKIRNADCSKALKLECIEIFVTPEKVAHLSRIFEQAVLLFSLKLSNGESLPNILSSEPPNDFFSPCNYPPSAQPASDDDNRWEVDLYYKDLVKELAYDLPEDPVCCLAPPPSKEISWVPKTRVQIQELKVHLFQCDNSVTPFAVANVIQCSVDIDSEAHPTDSTPSRQFQAERWRVKILDFFIQDCIETSKYENLCRGLGGPASLQLELCLNPVFTGSSNNGDDSSGFHLVAPADTSVATPTKNIEHSVYLTLPSLWVTLDMNLALEFQNFSQTLSEIEISIEETEDVHLSPGTKILVTLFRNGADQNLQSDPLSGSRFPFQSDLVEIEARLVCADTDSQKTVPLIRSFHCEPLLVRFDFTPSDTEIGSGPLQALNFLAHICTVEEFEVPLGRLKIEGLMTPQELVARVFQSSLSNLSRAQMLKYALRGTPLMRSFYDMASALKAFIRESVDHPRPSKSMAEELSTLRRYRDIFDEGDAPIELGGYDDECDTGSDPASEFIDTHSETFDSMFSMARRVLVWAEYQASSTVRNLLGQATVSAPAARRFAGTSTEFFKCVAVESIKISERVITSCSRKMTEIDENINGSKQQALSRAASADGPLWSLVEKGSSEFYEPENTLEGLSDAVMRFQRGWRSVTSTISEQNVWSSSQDKRMRVSLLSLEAVQTIGKVLPLLLLKPIVTLTGAASSALQGARNQLEPKRRAEKAQILRAPRVVQN